MRRLARRLLGLCSFLSLLLCVTACVLWVRSYSVADGFQYVTRADTETRLWQRVWQLSNARGTMDVLVVAGARRWDPLWLKASSKPKRLDPGFHYGSRARFADPRGATGAESSVWTRLGFRSASETSEDDSKRIVSHSYAFPHWLVVGLTALLPAAQFAAWRRRWRARRRHSAGLCVDCGYDLRSSPERCPECGTSVPVDIPRGLPPRVLIRRAATGALLIALGVCGWWVYGRWDAWRTSSRLAQGTTPIARFSFDRDDADEAGFGAKIERKNAPVEDGALVLNGFYEFGVFPGAAYRAVVEVPSLDYEAFTVMWRFKCDPMMQSGRWNLLTGGGDSRWMTLSRRPSGTLNIAFNNGRTAAQDVPGTDLKPGVWIQAAVSVNVQARRVLVMLDGHKAADIFLPGDFAFQRDGSGSGREEKAFMFTNYSRGETFAGQVDELVVFPRALSESELTSFWRPDPGGEQGDADAKVKRKK